MHAHGHTYVVGKEMLVVPSEMWKNCCLKKRKKERQQTNIHTYVKSWERVCTCGDKDA